MLIEIFFPNYNMSILAVHKRAKIGNKTCHIKYEKIRKKSFYNLLYTSHKLFF